MGGYGSGRDGYRPVVEDGVKLSVYYFQRKRLLKGIGGSLTWTNAETNERLAAINYQSNADGNEVSIGYTTTVNGEMHQVNESIRVTSTKVNYGHRCWWLCPGCFRRCGMLYFPPGAIYFRCRKCYNLTYRSSNNSSKPNYFDVVAAKCLGVSPREFKREMQRGW